MKQQNKYLALAVPSVALAGAASVACYVTEHSKIFGVAMFVWAVGCVCAIACAHGFADCANRRSESKMLDSYGAILGLKRRFFGLEYDSAYLGRITSKVMMDPRK